MRGRIKKILSLLMHLQEQVKLQTWDARNYKQASALKCMLKDKTLFCAATSLKKAEGFMNNDFSAQHLSCSITYYYEISNVGYKLYYLSRRMKIALKVMQGQRLALLCNLCREAETDQMYVFVILGIRSNGIEFYKHFCAGVSIH